MTLKEFGENLEKLNEAYKQLRKKYQKTEIGKTIEVAGVKWLVLDKLEKGKCRVGISEETNPKKYLKSSNSGRKTMRRSRLRQNLLILSE